MKKQTITTEQTGSLQMTLDVLRENKEAVKQLLFSSSMLYYSSDELLVKMLNNEESMRIFSLLRTLAEEL